MILRHHDVAGSFTGTITQQIWDLADAANVDVAIARRDVDQFLGGTFADKRQEGVDGLDEVNDVDFELMKSGFLLVDGTRVRTQVETDRFHQLAFQFCLLAGAGYASALMICHTFSLFGDNTGSSQAGCWQLKGFGAWEEGVEDQDV